MCSYIATYVHVKKGSQYTSITGIILQLICSQIFAVFTVLTFEKLNLERTQVGGWADTGNRTGNYTPAKILAILSGVAFIMQQTPFNACHFELAWIYKKLSRDAPKVIERAQELDERASSTALETETPEDKRNYAIIMAMNYVFPILAGGMSVAYQFRIIGCYEKDRPFGEQCEWTPDNPRVGELPLFGYDKLKWIFASFVLVVGLLQIVSGVILIRSVISIRTFFQEKDA